MISSVPPDTSPPGDRPLSLAACERLLTAALGQGAPALITMRRHARSGQLDACIARGGPAPSGHGRMQTRYDASRILAFYRARVDRPPQEPSQCAAPPVHLVGTTAVQHGAPSDTTQALLQTLLEENRSLRASLGDLTDRVLAMGAHVRDLNAVRVALMTKYDAATAAAIDRATRLEEENKSLRRVDDPVHRDLMRLRMDMSKVLERLDELNARG